MWRGPLLRQRACSGHRLVPLPDVPPRVVGPRAAVRAVRDIGLRHHARLPGALPLLSRGGAYLLPDLRIAAHVPAQRKTGQARHHDLQPGRPQPAAAGLSRVDESQAVMGGRRRRSAGLRNDALGRLTAVTSDGRFKFGARTRTARHPGHCRPRSLSAASARPSSRR